MNTPTLDDSLRQNREAVSRLLAVIERMSPEQWARPVAPGKWSPGQIVEHLALSYDVSRQVLQGTSPIKPLPAIVRPLIRFVVRRAVKTGKFPRGGKAREGFIPSERAPERTGVVQHLTASMEAFAAEYGSAATQGRTTLDHPAFGRISLVDYALFSALHTRHHTGQIPAAVST